MNIKLFLPDDLLRSEPCFIRGQYSLLSGEHIIHITAKSSIAKDIFTKNSKKNTIFGRFGACGKPTKHNANSFIDVDQKDCSIINLTLMHEKYNLNDSHVIVILYDYETVRLTENWEPPDEAFQMLHFLVGENRCKREARYEEKKETHVVWSWLSYLYFFVQLKSFFEIIKWLWTNIKRDKKISLQTGNMITALIVDIALGYAVISVLNIHNNDYTHIIMSYIESVVNYLHSLLKWLMGAPAGLKLNKAFNNMLGKFFIYNINLWWIFLELTKGGAYLVSQLFGLFGYLGVTFQAAIISDMISFVSFHLFCIYVYVARLFNIQMSGLAALLRLFVGRKRNPLRGGVDSCEYSAQELFVGTVAFTILIFLIPTTAMYYTVFTLFRLLSLSVKGVLNRLCFSIKSLPLYVFYLYVIGSPRVAGNIHMEVLHDSEPQRALVLCVRLKSRPLAALLATTRPALLTPPSALPWTQLLTKVLKGILISN